MITGLSGASIWSEDHTRLLPFYRDVHYGNLWIATLKDPEGNLIQLFQRRA